MSENQIVGPDGYPAELPPFKEFKVTFLYPARSAEDKEPGTVEIKIVAPDMQIVMVNALQHVFNVPPGIVKIEAVFQRSLSRNEIVAMLNANRPQPKQQPQAENITSLDDFLKAKK